MNVALKASLLKSAYISFIVMCMGSCAPASPLARHVSLVVAEQPHLLSGCPQEITVTVRFVQHLNLAAIVQAYVWRVCRWAILNALKMCGACVMMACNCWHSTWKIPMEPVRSTISPRRTSMTGIALRSSGMKPFTCAGLVICFPLKAMTPPARRASCRLSNGRVQGSGNPSLPLLLQLTCQKKGRSFDRPSRRTLEYFAEENPGSIGDLSDQSRAQGGRAVRKYSG